MSLKEKKKKQKRGRVLSAIKYFARKKNLNPTCVEIAERSEMSSMQAHRILKALIEDGEVIVIERQIKVVFQENCVTA